MTKKTYNKGANDERTAIIAYVKRLRKHYFTGLVTSVLDRQLRYLAGRSKRCNARKGGIGRK